ncbi:heavy metal translocating P-type ATPase [Enterococcus dispar]|uniref:P-type Cu(+) transporter n=1 Tax=Enterococcus dispar ATCC 51266 TaxID=1139219 RepID=S1NWK5_9ENTE|nr:MULTISPECIES: heavy metal translocating P-type ATPase [Enterococcus]EGO8740213.1 copper-translocating P-type ATPase [Enterococcus faecalis]EOI31556.1 copper-translocating P-type ATPase [Enterococcus faecalis EnGen0250]EOT43278.1 copper-transporting ATPase CopB [Enterococcus dispar ATCC 51266]EOW85274.1 copper-transporting ATPase CopB [Enterococcus dispar ATCC 51266]MDK4352120.1 copper-translocating P-type ATPase [Enterococcus thailandicus]
MSNKETHSQHNGHHHATMNHEDHHNGHDHEKMHHTNHEHGGMDHSMHMGNLKVKFIVSLFLSIPIILLSPMMGGKLPFQLTFQGSEWIVLILASILFFYGGMPFLKGAKMELEMKNPAMMTLISLGISVAYIYSVYAFIANNITKSNTHVMDFFWELATLILIMLLGHWIEMNAISNAGNALQKMAELLPNSAIIVDESGNTKEVDLKDVQVGERVLVKAGEKIPTDGVIVAGNTNVNESMVTGESKDVQKGLNDKVIGGSVNGSGTITVEVTGTGESGYLSQVMELVSNAQKEKSRVESLSDKVAKLLFYVALIVGIGAFIIWMVLTGDLNIALERMVTVLIIACPHALGLAIPLVTARSTSLGAKNGLLIKNRQALEVAKKVDVIMMDKTGTLTEGNFAVNEYLSFSTQYTEEQVLEFMAALEQNSSHPLSVGVLKKIDELQLTIPKAEDVTNLPGIGLEGRVNGKDIKIVSVSYLNKKSISYDKQMFNDLSNQGNSISFLLLDDQSIGLVAQGDQIKPEAKLMVEKMKARGIKPVMLTGDNKQVASVVAKQLGIDDVHAELMPEDKEKIVKEYKDKNLIVMMVGDGVNDAPSLVRASIGVAIGAGTDVAIDSADVILVKSNPSDILHFLSLAKNTQRKMVQNLWWGAGYNILAIPLAAGILASWGIILSPAIGAIFMSLSTVIVAINAMLLKID